MPKTPALAELVSIAAHRCNVSVNCFSSAQYQAMSATAEAAIEDNNFRRGASALKTPSGQALLDMIAETPIEPGAVTAARLADEKHVMLSSLTRQKREEVLKLSQKLELARSRKETPGAIKEIEDEILCAMRPAPACSA